MTKCDIPEGLDLQWYHFVNFRSREV